MDRQVVSTPARRVANLLADRVSRPTPRGITVTAVFGSSLRGLPITGDVHPARRGWLARLPWDAIGMPVPGRNNESIADVADSCRFAGPGPAPGD